MNTFTCAYKIQADIQQNRLYCLIHGYIVDEYVDRIILKVIHESGKLKKGFDVIRDVSNIVPATSQDASMVNSTFDYLINKGAGRIVEIGTNETADTVMSNFCRRFTVNNIEEAEKLLQS